MSDSIQHRINTDPDFIAIKRFGFSLKKLLERYPEGAPNHVIAQALAIHEDEVEVEYQTILVKLRQAMKVFDEAA